MVGLKLFIGVVSGMSSAAIRNKSICEEEDYHEILDLYSLKNLGAAKVMISLIRLVVLLSVRRRHVHLTISTNPKWAILFGVVALKRFSLHMGDPFVDDVSVRNNLKNTILWKLTKMFADEVFVTSESTAKIISKEVNVPVRIYKRKALTTNFHNDYSGGTHVKIVHFGDLGFNRCSVIFNQTQTKYKFTLAIYSNDTNSNTYGDVTIQYKPRIHLDEIATALNLYNIMLIVCNRSGSQIPGKIYDFMDVEIPVFIISNDINQEIKTFVEAMPTKRFICSEEKFQLLLERFLENACS